jgi:hypothetical protein
MPTDSCASSLQANVCELLASILLSDQQASQRKTRLVLSLLHRVFRAAHGAGDLVVITWPWPSTSQSNRSHSRAKRCFVSAH